MSCKGVCITASRWAPLRRITTNQHVAQAYSTLRPRPDYLTPRIIRQASTATAVVGQDAGEQNDEAIPGKDWESKPVSAVTSTMPKIPLGVTFSSKDGVAEDSFREEEIEDNKLNSISNISSRSEMYHWTSEQRQTFAKRIADFDSLERCLVWITQQGLRFELDPAPPWLLIAILRLPAQVNTTLELCHTIAPRLPGFDNTARNRLIALFLHRFADHGMINAVEPIYRLRRKSKDKDNEENPMSAPNKNNELDDEGELAILRALQRLVLVMATDRKGSEAKAVLARKLLATHVKQLAGAKARLLSPAILDSLYQGKYLSKPLIRALETVRKRKKIELSTRWARTMFQFAIRHKDHANAYSLLDQLKTHLAADSEQSERNTIFNTLLRSLRHLDPSSTLYHDISNIQHQYPVEDFNTQEGTASKARNIAFSHQLSIAALSDKVASGEWDQICRNTTENAIDSRTLTVMMEGYLLRDEANSAWKLWQRLYTDVDLDILVITTVVKVLAKLRKVDEAIQLINACTRLPTRLIDRRAVNELLRVCAESGKLDCVQRIWEEMEVRWQIRPDEVTLGTLIYATQINPPAQNVSFAQLVKRSFFSETSDLRLYETNSQDPEPEQDSDSLTNHATSQDGQWWHSPSDAGRWLNWKSVRALFRHILFRNYPFLINVRSPLEGGFASGLSNIMFGQRTQSQSGQSSYATEITQALGQLPIYSRHYDITYTQHTFHSFICLLNQHNLGDEMALCLGWMKILKIQPQRKTLCLILLKVEELSSPKQMRHRTGVSGWKGYALMTDGEWLREWLIEWLGKKAVPSEEELADFLMHRWEGK